MMTGQLGTTNSVLGTGYGLGQELPDPNTIFGQGIESGEAFGATRVAKPPEYVITEDADLVPPSHSTGYAKCAAESAYPELWEGLTCAWVPALGPSPDSGLIDYSGHGHTTTQPSADRISQYNEQRADGLQATNNSAELAAQQTVDFPGDITCSVIYWLSRPLNSTEWNIPFNDGASSTSNNRCVAYVPHSSNVVYWYYGDTDSDILTYNVSSDPIGPDEVWGFTGGAHGLEMFRNAALIASDNTFTNPTMNKGRTFGFFKHPATAASTDTIQHALLTYNRRLTAEEMVTFRQDPLAPFRLRSRVMLNPNPPGSDLVIEPGGIASGEVIGDHVVVSGIYPTGIASAEAIGSHTVVLTGLIQPTGIASEEAIGSHVISSPIAPEGIASEEAIGSHTVTTGDQISPEGIASLEAVGSHHVKLNIHPEGIASAEAIGSHAVVTEAQVVSPDGIASLEAFGTHHIKLNIHPTGIASLEAFGSHFIVGDIQPEGIASGETFGSHLIADEGYGLVRRPLYYDPLTGDLTQMSIADASSGPATASVTNNTGSALPNGAPVYHTGTLNNVAAADASASSTAKVLGLVNPGLADGTPGPIVVSGPIAGTLAEWDALTGDSGGLTPGGDYFLSETAGELTTTPVSADGSVSLRIGRALTAQILNVQIGEPISL